MEQLKKFDVEKQVAIERLEHLKKIVATLGEIGVDVTSDLKKITDALESVKDDVLRIALLGAFSDGKTSVIAAWLGKVMEDMNIDMDESSDRLAIYKPDGLPAKCEIVDTPGLFGDKVKEVEGQQVVYGDLTKRYISEAHLVIYVVDATNPLKDSHSDVARWVLRDLNKLTSTVFVINKMDEVTDLTEPELFKEQSAIKKANLIGKLQRAANLSDEEVAKLCIVCMASNPNGRGLPFWFGKPEVYEARSRINELRTVTQDILTANVPAALIYKTGLDVVSDVVAQRVDAARTLLTELEIFAGQHEQESYRIKEDISQGKAEVNALARELFRELKSMEDQLLAKLRSASLEDIRPYLEDELGYTEEGVGYKLYAGIKLLVSSYFEHAMAVTSGLSKNISLQLDSSESFLSSMSNGALKAIGSTVGKVSEVSPAALKGTIFAARDVLANVTGYAYKFKPWEASKLAGGVTKWAGPAGAAFTLGSDILNAYKAHELEQELKKTKASIAEIIKAPFKDICEILADDTKMMNFFAPQIRQFEKIVHDLDGKAAQIRSNREQLMSIEGQLQGLASPREAVVA